MKSGTDAVGLDYNPILTDTTAQAAMTPTEAIPGHTTGTADASMGVLPSTHAQMPIHIALAMTPHINFTQKLFSLLQRPQQIITSISI